MAESNRFAADSNITLYDHSMNPYLGKVAGIYENRVGNYSVMERRVYAAIFGKLPVNNAYYVLLNNANADSIRSRVSAVKGFAGIEMTSDRYNSLKNTTSILELLPAVYIFIVALMAFFVLYNLFRMSVVTKKDDLAMMKLSGFPVKEMKRYVSLELIIDSVVGIVAGLIAGTGLGYVLLMLVQGSDLHIIKTVRFETWGIAVPVMAFVCFAVSIFAMRKVRRVSIKN
jgi:ABC-type antimicrobial peptide transport system permease subunit